ncbi:PTS mannitol transporter subunit IIA [Cryobacterium sp. TMT1-21]|uniref:Mannitol-specific phosphotransferase enzyme IIA component n=1 Tax=Cryobacterium shii TaxID=1259235 RepID=A0AAQ2C4K7_9MICO|nr:MULTISPECIES: PTS sugar transporter subunit IIA [Cryobacterium]TFC43386.1 PTS mannitol transporter subunit IIA [Cryobacterium shii]TFC87290.1 PTS mannitol transporter subunit IIA [Cryobacterium sp. TmT2-59]TFD10428.1 PTS mannitol transporter subunit IIA [Cryobacterium sp. TMT1-21]TFD13147.1 PTS mannitol transporter subunit IIA [Cryobacterium sp. TMT4-10]TFD27857.1 PTS mannitol transporter subunit IIA [Cryobacterium sp. TMT2-23]
MTQHLLELVNVVTAGSATTRNDAIREAGALLVRAGAVREDYIDSMFEREASVSTYMGNFLAIPHGTNDAKASVIRSALSIVRYADPIDWDGHPVRFAVGIAGLNNEHLEILSRMAAVFSDEGEVQRLLDAATAEDIVRLLDDVNAE